MAVNFQAKEKKTQYQLEVDLQGVLTASVRAEIVVDFIKYVLYQRQQIPMLFEDIRKDVIKLEQGEHGKEQKSKLGSKQLLEEKKMKTFIDNFSEMTHNITQLFTQSVSVKRVLVLLGSSIVTPKEAYVLNFPTSVFDGRVLSLKHCKSMLFKQLVAASFFGDVSTPKLCSKLFVMAEAVEANEKVQLLPKLSYKPPLRGNHLELNFNCHSKEISANLTRINEADLDMSGIEVLNQSSIDTDLCSSERSNHRNSHRDQNEQGSTRESIGSSDTAEMEIGPDSPERCVSPMASYDNSHIAETGESLLNYIWFQIPVVIQGFKDMLTKEAGKML